MAELADAHASEACFLKTEVEVQLLSAAPEVSPPVLTSRLSSTIRTRLEERIRADIRKSKIR